MEDMDAAVAMIEEFLDEGEETEGKTDLPEGTAVILFVDIVAVTALTERMGNVAVRAKAGELDTSLRSVIVGSVEPWSSVGRSVMASWPSSPRHARRSTRL